MNYMENSFKQNKECYREWCSRYDESNSNLPIYFQPWWLDIVCVQGQWNVCLYKNKNGDILGVLPYYFNKYFGFRIIRTPPLTPTLGVWLDYSQCSHKRTSKYSFEMKAIGSLVDQLPIAISYHQIQPPQFNNWYPFFFHGYQQTTRYTYILEKLDVDYIIENLKSEVRTRIRKAEKLFTVVDSFTIEEFISFYNKSMKRQGISLASKEIILKSIHNELYKREKGRILFALNEEQTPAAALYLIWDKESAYYWLPCMEIEKGGDGAAQLLILNSIEFISKRVSFYNFEGSMLHHIEPMFRAFGGKRKSIFQIRKFRNPIFHALWWLFKGRAQI